MAPVPANKSNTSSSAKSMLLAKILKRASRAVSVVGRALKFLGGEKRRPLKEPLTIRIRASLADCKTWVHLANERGDCSENDGAGCWEQHGANSATVRSEERRVGKECRSRWAREH